MIDAKGIKDFGRQLGIDNIRITTADPFPTALAAFKQQKQDGLFTDRKHRHFKNKDIAKFYNVQTKLPQAKSIVAACQCYLTDENAALTEPGKPYGRIARYTWRNHYLDLKKRLEKLAEFMKKEHQASYIVYSNGPVAEKPIAQRSGIGYFGKHSIIINQTYGSWIVLGEIITDIEIEPDKPLEIDCGDCHVCIDACPTSAIIRPFTINRNRCIQELTNWYGVIADDIARIWEDRLYGCTVCQDVCPVNKKVQPRNPQTDLGYVGPSLSLIDILQMDEKTYRDKYPNNQITAHWINFTAIKRNAIIALGNIKDKKTLPILNEFTKNQDGILSATAQWAITNFSHA